MDRFGASDARKKLTREQALKKICQYIPNKIPKISTTGMLSRELYELNKKNKNPHNTFMCVGGMGHAISIATGLAKAKKKIKVFCLDGDGSSLMHMGSMVSSAKCKNLIHIVFNNNSHDSVGGQKTAANNLKFKKVALALGYSEVFSISNEKEISKVIKLCLKNRNSSFIEINCQSGHRKNLIRPIETPEFNKKKFVQFIKKNYG